MQTFLPYPSFRASAEVLDYRRLGKQRVEARQILRALEQGGGWAHHPAVAMWRGYEGALRLYHDCVIWEWVLRGYRNTMPYLWRYERDWGPWPPWHGDAAFHASHRSNLLRKAPGHYGLLGWAEGPDLPYVWPVP